MTHYERNCIYLAQLRAFKDYMDSVFDVLMWNGDEESTELFYRSKFEIKFRGKTITLENSADVYSAIECLIDNEIQEMEEEI